MIRKYVDRFIYYWFYIVYGDFKESFFYLIVVMFDDKMCKKSEKKNKNLKKVLTPKF